jgi:hypothetical protein
VEFNAGEALNIARSLSFPRAVGSAGEGAAASMIERKLSEAGYLPQREEFFIFLTPWGAMKGFILFAILILLGARFLVFFYPMISALMILSIVFFLVFYPSIWAKFVASKAIRRWFIGRNKKSHSRRSQNIAATLSAHGRAEQYIYLVAHHDSKSQSLPLLLRAFCLLVATVASLWLGFSYFYFSKETLSFFPSGRVDLALALALIGMIPILLLKTGNLSPGGLDNAGSLGILLHLADVLKQTRPLHSQVTFLFTGAEEVGLQGAFAFVQRHKDEIEKGRSYFLNLDSVGVKGATRIFFRKGGLPIGREPLFVSRMKKIGQPFGIETGSFSFGIMMDHQAFLEKGYPAVSFACASKKILSVHTARDTADQLEEEGMAEAGNFLLAWIKSWGE